MAQDIISQKQMRIPTYSKLPSWASPLALLALTAVVYGPFLPHLGFYWDDWVFAWIRTHVGAQGLIELFNVTSPIRGWMETPLTLLLGVNPLSWQVFSLLTRWLAAVSFWWLLCSLWPERRGEGFFASSIMLVYPGYSQQPLAMTYYFFWVFEAVFFLSLGLMTQSIQKEKMGWGLFFTSLTLSGLHLVSMEYLVGLELMRPLLLLLVFSRFTPTWRERLKKTVLFELPYALVLAVYVYWRLFLFGKSLYSPVVLSRLEQSPLETLANLTASILDALKQVNWDAWLQIINLPRFSEWGLLLNLIYFLVIIFSFFGILFILPRLQYSDSLPLDWVLTGLGGMLLAGLPFLAAGLSIQITFPEDRFTLAYMPLVGLFLAGLLWLIRNEGQRAMAAGLIIAFAAGYQVQVLEQYRDDWKIQRNFAWQLAWRAPNLLNGTVVVSEDTDTFHYNDDEALTALLNWMYIPANTALPNFSSYSFISARWPGNFLEIQKSVSDESSPILVTHFAPPACLRIFNPQYDDILLSLPNLTNTANLSAPKLPFIPDPTLQAAPLSNPALATSGAFPAIVPDFLGPEPAHGWCYTYLKADLARQQGDWEQVARLGDEAFAIPLLPDAPYEYLPFVEAYARTGRIKDAQTLTQQVAVSMPLLRPNLCAIWNRTPGLPPETIQEMRQVLQICPVNP
jgi:hypothetical protein